MRSAYQKIDLTYMDEGETIADRTMYINMAKLIRDDFSIALSMPKNLIRIVSSRSD